MLPGKATPLSILAAGQAPQKDIIPGFIRAAETVSPKVYPPPKIPASYEPHHDFPEDAVPGEPALPALPCFDAAGYPKRS